MACPCPIHSYHAWTNRLGWWVLDSIWWFLCILQLISKSQLNLVMLTPSARAPIKYKRTHRVNLRSEVACHCATGQVIKWLWARASRKPAHSCESVQQLFFYVTINVIITSTQPEYYIYSKIAAIKCVHIFFPDKFLLGVPFPVFIVQFVAVMV